MARMPALKAWAALSESEIGRLLLAPGISAVLMIAASSRLVARFGSCRILAAGVLSAAAGLVTAAGAADCCCLAAAFVLFGLGEGLWDVAVNVQAMSGQRRWNLRVILIMHALYKCRKIDKGSLLVVDASTVDATYGNTAVFSGIVNVEKGAKVYLANVVNGNTIKLSANEDAQLNGDVYFEGDLLLNEQMSGSTVTIKSADLKTLKSEFGDVAGIDAAWGMFDEGANLNNNSKSAAFNKWLYTSTSSAGVASGDRVDTVRLNKIAADVASLGATTGVQTMTMDAVNQMGETVADRVSLLTQRAAGVNVWAAANGGMFEAKSLFDGAGYESDIYSGVLGVDYQFACNAVLGAALTIGTADTDNKNSTVKASTDSDLVGFSVYASKTFADVLGVSADIGYLTASNDVTANGYGQAWKFSQDTDAFTIGLRTEVLAEVGAVKLVPHIGIRYTALSTDGFEAGYKTEIDDQNIFQMPVGVTVSGDFKTGDWTVAPKFDLSVVPTFGDKDADLKLGITGVNATDDLAVRVIDSNPVQATLGVNATNGAWGFGLNYKLGVGSDDRMNNTFNVNVRYAF